MSSGGSFWHKLRWRLGTDDAMLAQISDLIQKQIDANSDVQEVTEESILNPIIISPSKMVLRDNLFKTTERTILQGLTNFLPIDPDLDKMRLWLLNNHGGRYLSDFSMMGSMVQLNGSDQSKLTFTTDDDAIERDRPVNRLIDDQYIRVEDKDASPNLNVRIKEIAATETGITIFVRLFVLRNINEETFGKPGVLFSKIDTEQVDYAYAAYLKSNGSIVWIVREAGKEYSVATPVDALVWPDATLAEYSDVDYSALDYRTTGTIYNVPDPIPYVDLAFTYTFATKRMQVIKNIQGEGAGESHILVDTNTAPEGTGLVAAFKLNEGGDIGNTPDAPSSFARTIYNSSTSAGATNGLISNATWDSSNYLNFDGNNDFADANNYTGIQNLSAWTISLWYYPKAVPGTDAYLVRKGALTASSWLVYHLNNGSARFSVWNATPTRFDITMASAFPALNTWYHVVAKVTIGAPGKIFVNNVKTTGGANVTGTVDTSTNVLRLGGTTSTTTPTGLIHDLKIFNRELSDAEVTTLYGAGHQAAFFPSWQANPPTVPPTPGSITNPFVSVYNVAVPAAPEQDLVRLHAITISSQIERYNVGQGAQESPPVVGEDGQYYNNDPTYDSGTSVQEVVSDYNTMTTTASTYMELSDTKFGGQRFLTGINVIGKPITKIIVKMADVNPTNAPATGNITAKIIKNSDNTNQLSSTTVAATALTDNPGGSNTSLWSDHTFTFTNNVYNMANNDRVQLEYQFDSGAIGGGGGGDPTGHLFASYNFLNATLSSTQVPIAGFNGRAGQLFSLGDMVGEHVTGIKIKLCDPLYAGTQSSGNVTAKICNGLTVYATSNAINANTLPDNSGGTAGGGWLVCTFTFADTSHTMTSGDSIQIDFNWTGPTNQSVALAVSSSSVTNESVAFNQYNTGSTTTLSARDVAMDVYVA